MIGLRLALAALLLAGWAAPARAQMLGAVEPGIAAAVVAERDAEVAHAITAGRLMQAQAMLAPMVVARPADRGVLELVARLAYAERRYRAALDVAERLAATGPVSAQVSLVAGLSALALGDASAGAHLRTAAEGDAGLWEAWNGLGVLADRQADWAAALADYRRAIAAGGAQAAVINNIGWSLLLQQRYADAAALLADAGEDARASTNRFLARRLAQPEAPAGADWSARDLNNAGYARLIAGDARQAAELFEAALARSPVFYARAEANLERARQAGSAPLRIDSQQEEANGF